MANLTVLFGSSSKFNTLIGAEECLYELQEDILDVQFPDSTRGLNRDRNEVTMRMKRWIGQCKVQQMRADDKDIAAWNTLAIKGEAMHDELIKTKDVVTTIFNEKRVW